MLVRIDPQVQSRSRHIDLLPVRISLIPEHRSPRLVQFIQCFIFLFYKFTESDRICLRIELIRLTVQFIVYLPSDDGRMLSVVLRLLLCDPGAELLINGRIVIIVLPAAVSVDNALFRSVEHFRIFLREPCRRCRRRRPEYDLHSFSAAQIQEFVKEIKCKSSLFRFDDCPCELRDADDCDPRIQHPLKIILPE